MGPKRSHPDDSSPRTFILKIRRTCEPPSISVMQSKSLHELPIPLNSRPADASSEIDNLTGDSKIDVKIEDQGTEQEEGDGDRKVFPSFSSDVTIEEYPLLGEVKEESKPLIKEEWPCECEQEDPNSRAHLDTKAAADQYYFSTQPRKVKVAEYEHRKVFTSSIDEIKLEEIDTRIPTECLEPDEETTTPDGAASDGNSFVISWVPIEDSAGGPTTAENGIAGNVPRTMTADRTLEIDCLHTEATVGGGSKMEDALLGITSSYVEIKDESELIAEDDVACRELEEIHSHMLDDCFEIEEKPKPLVFNSSCETSEEIPYTLDAPLLKLKEMDPTVVHRNPLVADEAPKDFEDTDYEELEGCFKSGRESKQPDKIYRASKTSEKSQAGEEAPIAEKASKKIVELDSRSPNDNFEIETKPVVLHQNPPVADEATKKFVELDCQAPEDHFATEKGTKRLYQLDPMPHLSEEIRKHVGTFMIKAPRLIIERLQLHIYDKKPKKFEECDSQTPEGPCNIEKESKPAERRDHVPRPSKKQRLRSLRNNFYLEKQTNTIVLHQNPPVSNEATKTFVELDSQAPENYFAMENGTKPSGQLDFLSRTSEEIQENVDILKIKPPRLIIKRLYVYDETPKEFELDSQTPEYPCKIEKKESKQAERLDHVPLPSKKQRLLSPRNDFEIENQTNFNKHQVLHQNPPVANEATKKFEELDSQAPEDHFGIEKGPKPTDQLDPVSRPSKESRKNVGTFMTLVPPRLIIKRLRLSYYNKTSKKFEKLGSQAAGDECEMSMDSKQADQLDCALGVMLEEKDENIGVNPKNVNTPPSDDDEAIEESLEPDAQIPGNHPDSENVSRPEVQLGISSQHSGEMFTLVGTSLNYTTGTVLGADDKPLRRIDEEEEVDFSDHHSSSSSIELLSLGNEREAADLDDSDAVDDPDSTTDTPNLVLGYERGRLQPWHDTPTLILHYERGHLQSVDDIDDSDAKPCKLSQRTDKEEVTSNHDSPFENEFEDTDLPHTEAENDHAYARISGREEQVSRPAIQLGISSQPSEKIFSLIGTSLNYRTGTVLGADNKPLRRIDEEEKVEFSDHDSSSSTVQLLPLGNEREATDLDDSDTVDDLDTTTDTPNSLVLGYERGCLQAVDDTDVSEAISGKLSERTDKQKEEATSDHNNSSFEYALEAADLPSSEAGNDHVYDRTSGRQDPSSPDEVPVSQLFDHPFASSHWTEEQRNKIVFQPTPWSSRNITKSERLQMKKYVDLFPWICEENQFLYCWPCILFAPRQNDTVWHVTFFLNYLGPNPLKVGLKRILLQHENTNMHSNALTAHVEKWEEQERKQADQLNRASETSEDMQAEEDKTSVVHPNVKTKLNYEEEVVEFEEPGAQTPDNNFESEEDSRTEVRLVIPSQPSVERLTPSETLVGISSCYTAGTVVAAVGNPSGPIDEEEEAVLSGHDSSTLAVESSLWNEREASNLDESNLVDEPDSTTDTATLILNYERCRQHAAVDDSEAEPGECSERVDKEKGALPNSDLSFVNEPEPADLLNTEAKNDPFNAEDLPSTILSPGTGVVGLRSDGVNGDPPENKKGESHSQPVARISNTIDHQEEPSCSVEVSVSQFTSSYWTDQQPEETLSQHVPWATKNITESEKQKLKKYFDKFPWVCEENHVLYCWQCILFAPRQNHTVWHVAHYLNYLDSNPRKVYLGRILLLHQNTNEHEGAVNIFVKKMIVREKCMRLWKSLVKTVCSRENNIDFDSNPKFASEAKTIVKGFYKKGKLDHRSMSHLCERISTFANDQLMNHMILEVQSAMYVALHFEDLSASTSLIGEYWLAVVARHAEWNGSIQKRVIDFVKISPNYARRSATVVVRCIEEVLREHQLTYNVVAFSHSSSVVVPSEIPEFHKQLMKICPRAICFYYPFCDLRKGMFYALMRSSDSQAFFVEAQELYEFIVKSSIENPDHDYDLNHPLTSSGCDDNSSTPIDVSVGCIPGYISNCYSSLIAKFQHIIKTKLAKSKTPIEREAMKFSGFLQSFENRLMIIVVAEIFSVVSNLGSAVERLDWVDAKKGLDEAVSSLHSMLSLDVVGIYKMAKDPLLSQAVYPSYTSGKVSTEVSIVRNVITESIAFLINTFSNVYQFRYTSPELLTFPLKFTRYPILSKDFIRRANLNQKDVDQLKFLISSRSGLRDLDVDLDRCTHSTLLLLLADDEEDIPLRDKYVGLNKYLLYVHTIAFAKSLKTQLLDSLSRFIRSSLFSNPIASGRMKNLLYGFFWQQENILIEKMLADPDFYSNAMIACGLKMVIDDTECSLVENY